MESNVVRLCNQALVAPSMVSSRRGYFSHGGAFYATTDKPFVRKSVDSLPSCATEIVEVDEPILIIVDFSVDEEALACYEQLRAMIDIFIQ